MFTASSLDPKNQEHQLLQDEYEVKNAFFLFFHPSYLKLNIQDAVGFQTCLEYTYLAFELIQKSLEALFSFELKKFDALIGNNSCFLSTYHVFKIAITFRQDKEFETYAKNLYQNIAFLKKKPHLADITSEEKALLTFENFLMKYDLIPEIDKRIVYLSFAFLLAIAKEKTEQEIEEICYAKLNLFFQSFLKKQISSKLGIKLIKHIQRQITYLGIQFLYQDLESEAPTCIWNKYIYPPFLVVDERKRLCTPSLFTQKIIFDLLKKAQGIHFCLAVHIIEKPKAFKKSFFIFYKVLDGKIERIPEEKASKTLPYFVYAGCRYVDLYDEMQLDTILGSFCNQSLEEMIFAHEVTYPQYSKALKLSDIIPDEIELQKALQADSHLKGCSLDDPSFLCLAHIYPSSLNELKKAHLDAPVYLPTF